MDVLIYMVVLLAASAALVSLSYVWVCALCDALRTRSATSERGAGNLWPLMIVALGWLGALLYWNTAASRPYSRTRIQ
jgi:amino acid transporter